MAVGASACVYRRQVARSLQNAVLRFAASWNSWYFWKTMRGLRPKPTMRRTVPERHPRRAGSSPSSSARGKARNRNRRGATAPRRPPATKLPALNDVVGLRCAGRCPSGIRAAPAPAPAAARAARPEIGPPATSLPALNDVVGLRCAGRCPSGIRAAPAPAPAAARAARPEIGTGAALPRRADRQPRRFPPSTMLWKCLT
ncbi:uncharacterized protein isoform X2 [Choristoneura fumiferana]